MKTLVSWCDTWRRCSRAHCFSFLESSPKQFISGTQRKYEKHYTNFWLRAVPRCGPACTVTSMLVFLNTVDVILFLLLPLARIMEVETDKLAEK